jgi:hypothetical protein
MMYGQNNGYYMPNYNPYVVQNGAMPDMLNQVKMQYAQPLIPTQMSGAKIVSDMIWVLNENEATSYPVAPNNSVVLWDKSNPTIYVKSVNAQGVPSIRVLDFVERTETKEMTPPKHECKCGDKFVTKEQFEALRGDFEAFVARCNEVEEKSSAGKTIKCVKKEVE